MSDLKKAECILNNIRSCTEYFDNLNIGLDQDGLFFKYGFRLNSFTYHLKKTEDGLYQYSNSIKKESELSLGEGIEAAYYTNKHGTDKIESSLEDAVAFACKIFSKSKLKSVNCFFKEEAEEMGTEDSSLKGFISVFKENFNDFLVGSTSNTLTLKSDKVELSMVMILDTSIIKDNNKTEERKFENKFDAVEYVFEKIISDYIDEKTTNKLDLKNLIENDKKLDTKRKLH